MKKNTKIVVAGIGGDFLKPNGKTELETITGYVVHEGKRLGVPVPCFEQAYKKLKTH